MSKFIPDSSNELFRLADRLVNESSKNIFLTGKAGTGKTSFLKYIRENCLKQMAVVAPTGVAAINAGGVTIHSFFQLPLSPFLPSGNGPHGSQGDDIMTRHELVKRLRLSAEKKKMLQQLELLVIDEISMVRCDTLDAMDTILRFARRCPSDPFGGVQLLFIGDMMQLPPVIKDGEWVLLSEHYEGPYFFNSHAIKAEMPVHIEFDKIYRQTEEKFIGLLNQVRNNRLDDEGLVLLEERYKPQFKRTRGDGYIVLTTHNEKARHINMGELAGLPGNARVYEARIEDEFSERAYPAEDKLELKTGAQVMFIRNDGAERGRRYFNGRIGTVTRLENDRIFVKCGNEENDIEVVPEKWENIRYTLDPSTRALARELLGSFTQFPLRLAWAITIHKSQGLTFEKAIIDAGAAFAPGQVYVALSRCTSLEGLILQTRINSSSLAGDRKLLAFSEKQATPGQIEEEFTRANKAYKLRLLTELFNVQPALDIMAGIREGMAGHKASLHEDSIPWAENLLEKLASLQETSKKFAIQLAGIMMDPVIQDDKLLEERTRAAALYFGREFNMVIQLIMYCPVVTDSYVHAREFNEDMKDLFATLDSRQYILRNGDLLDIGSIQRLKKNYRLPEFSFNAYSAGKDQKYEQEHPELYRELKRLRDQICKKEGLPVYFVAGSATLKEMTRYLPQTEEELRTITGFGNIKTTRFGSQFLELIVAYTSENGLYSLVHEKVSKKKKASSPAGSKKRSSKKPGTNAGGT